MKILVFSDLHAHKDALNEITPHLNACDLSIFCGDVVGYGKDITTCIDFVSNNVDIVVLGNHDRFAITDEPIDKQLPVVQDSIIYTRNALSEDQKEWLLNLPKEIWVDDFYVTHSLGDDYLVNPSDYKRLYRKMKKSTTHAFFGHTHQQTFFQYKNKNIINPGSAFRGRNGYDRGFVIISDDNVEFVVMENTI